MKKRTTRSAEKLPVPVGDSNWAEFSQCCYTVDKTLLIKELIDDHTKVALFTRPRRFGKTTMLKMIKAFFEKTPKDTSYLFKNFKIWAAGRKYRDEQGKYPVIYLTLKDVDGANWEEAFKSMKRHVGEMIAEHSDAIRALGKGEDAARLRRVMNERGDLDDTGAALGLLARTVHAHELARQKKSAKGKCVADDIRPVILIDEYDAPVNRASVRGYLPEMTAFMKAFLSGALKDNDHVKMGVMTGVLRVAKEGILSGLNNPDVWTVFDERYSGYFGFSEDEVAAMARYYDAADKMPEIKSWYDGYNFAGTEIYNPWSVLRYFRCRCKPGPYWLDTSSNDLITEIVRDLPHDMAETLEGLLGDGAQTSVKMTQELGPYAQIRERKETLYALLVSAGYLKCCSPIADEYCTVAIPNREISQVFVSDIVSKLSSGMKIGPDDIARALMARAPVKFRDAIQRFLIESVSYFDAAAEGFYHGLTLGFLAVLRDKYRVRSNREAGDGRFDIALFPLVPGFPGVVLEVKHAKRKSESLARLASAARRQIDRKGCAAAFKAEGVTDVMKLGVAYYRKDIRLCEKLKNAR